MGIFTTRKKKRIEDNHPQKYKAYYKDFYNNKTVIYIARDFSSIVQCHLIEEIDKHGNVVYTQQYLIHAEPYYEEENN